MVLSRLGELSLLCLSIKLPIFRVKLKGVGDYYRATEKGTETQILTPDLSFTGHVS